MQIILNQTQHKIGSFEQIFQDLREVFTKKPDQTQGRSSLPTLNLFPELYFTGYPLQDLVLQMDFIENYKLHFEKFSKWLEDQEESHNTVVLAGGLEYDFDKNGLPLHIKNIIYDCRPGCYPKKVYTKQLLPNYDIFDEEKYFKPGNKATHIEFSGKKVGLLICEDMWFSSTHEVDPVHLLESHAKEIGGLDLVVNLSASPYFLGKQAKREKRGKELTQIFQTPFFYVNRVGGEDEILFDGQSFATNGTHTLTAKSFEKDILEVNLNDFKVSKNSSAEIKKDVENSWESLYEADLSYKKDSLPCLRPWTDEECHEVFKALCFGLREYAHKCGFNKFIIALSGGIDSGLVLHIARYALGKNQFLEAIYMPSKYSGELSTKLAEELCYNLQVPLTFFPIKFLHSTFQQEFLNHTKKPLKGISDENIQSRIRGNILYACSNQTGAMAINTSNKSELAVGYSTQYGDSVGALSLLGDLYKSQVYDLARYLEKTYGQMPKKYIERAPTAELRDNQEDSQSLPPYERLDAILEGLLSYRLSQKMLSKLGFNSIEIKKTYDLYVKSEYKRKQFCPIIKIKAKSFGFGYRVPITKAKFD